MNRGKNFVLRMAFMAMGYLGTLLSPAAQVLAQTNRPCNGVSDKPMTTMVQKNLPARQLPTRDAHMALLYYTTDGLKARVADMKTPLGGPMVIDNGSQFAIWNNATERYDTLMAGLRVYDQKTPL